MSAKQYTISVYICNHDNNRNEHCMTSRLILKTLRIMHDLCLADTIDKFKAKKYSQAKVVER